MKKRLWINLLLMLGLAPPLVSQNPAAENILSPEAFFQQVKTHHPLAKQAFLLTEQANAALLSAKGGFDPKLYGDWQRKSFDGKKYYSTGEGGVKLPTWFGVEGKAAYHVANGVFVNPENTLPANGQAVLGVTLPLLQGLVLDERRASLYQARLLRQVNEAEQRQMLNDLLLDAAKTYWYWALAFAYTSIYQEAIEVANLRFEGVRESYVQGDKPAIDTLEALLLVQDRQAELNEARLLFQNATLDFQNFLWQNETPAAVEPAVRPVALNMPVFLNPVEGMAPDSLAAVHPAVRQYEFKLQQMEVERRLKAEYLKPRLDISYNLLGDGFDFSDNGGNNFNDIFFENYKWGITAGFPLFLRKERGALQLANLKILDTSYELSQKEQEVRNKIAAYQNELNTLRQQILLASDMTDNYAALLAGEREKFAIGESSLFLVNSRENKLIEARLKLAKLQAAYRIAGASLEWAQGRLGQ